MHLEVSTAPIYDDQNKLIGSVHSAKDVTQRKKAESQTIEQNEFLTNIISSLSHPFYVINVKDYAVEMGNPASGFEDTDKNITCYELTHKTKQPCQGDHICPLKEVVKTKKPVRSEHIHHGKNGRTRNVEVYGYPIFDKKGNVVQMIEYSLDITERKLAEESLKESEERFRAVFDNASDGILLADAKSKKFVMANKTMAKMLGYSKNALTNMAVMDIHPKKDSPYVIEQFEKQAKGEIELAKDIPLLRKDGTMFYADVNASPITLSGKTYLMGIFRDVTVQKQIEDEKKKIQKQLLQSQKMESVGTLAGGIAHDFNNILQTIIGYTDLLLPEFDVDDERRGDIEEISKAGKRAASLTRQLLAFSRRQPLEAKVINLNETIKEMHKMLHRLIGEDIKLITQLDKKVMQIKADPGQIEQVIMNLAINAHDAMPKGGEVTIKTENINIDKEYCASYPEAHEGEFIRLSFSDTGCGMNKKTMARIFEPFFSTKELGRGTGLGLSVLYGIVRQHKGWINVYSEPGQGSSFKIYLPALATKVKDHETKHLYSLKGLKGKGERILLVEDDAAIKKFAIKVLTNKGYKIFSASTVKEALEAFAKEKGVFDLVLSDVVLPDKNGLELVEELLLQKPKLRVIMNSGYTNHKAQQETIAKKGYTFMNKPYTVNELLKTIKEALNA